MIPDHTQLLPFPGEALHRQHEILPAGAASKPTQPTQFPASRVSVSFVPGQFIGTGRELEQRIGEFDAILIRSATKLTPELIEKADNMKVIGRAGTGVDNVDIPAATKRGIIVANAPESNSVAAAEHTMALALALFRNVPQAHSALVDGRWDRAKYKGAELYGKTLGVIGFGRIGQLVAKFAQGFEMEVLAFDKFVSHERFRDLGVEGVDSAEEIYRRADLITIHLPKTPETVDWIDAEAIARFKPGMRIVNCARGELVNLDALKYSGNLNNLTDLAAHPRYTFVQADICDQPAVRAVLRDYRIEGIINLAAETHVDRSILDPGAFARTDVVGTGILLEEARQQGVQRYLQVSTDEVYGSVEQGSSTEEDRLEPRSPYSASKAGGDLLVLSYWTTYRFPVVITRGSNTYGPNQYPEKFIPLFVTNLIEKMLTYALGRGLESDDRCVVDKVAEAVAADGHKASRLMIAIVTSDPFQRRGAERTEK